MNFQHKRRKSERGIEFRGAHGGRPGSQSLREPPPRLGLILVVASVCALAPAAAQNATTPREAESALHRATEYYVSNVSTGGGYHFRYSADLSYGRSEQAEGPTQVSVQRDGTPIVGMAYLRAYEATGDRFYLEAARGTANALVQGQHCSGGWDYIIEFDPAKRENYPYRADDNCGVTKTPTGAPIYTTLDDNVSQAALRLLMRVDRELEFKDKKIHEAAMYALDRLSKAQYPNGAWPQRFHEYPNPADYPVKKASYPESWPRSWPNENYRGNYTFNDNSIVDMIDAFLEASRIYKEPKYQAVAEKGAGFILLAQMPEPQPAWAQQYDRDMHPVWARQFEPASISGGESQNILQMLLVLYRETGDRKYLEPIARALKYLKSSGLPERPNQPARKTRSCPPGTLCLARFYELRTNKPLFITKGTMVNVQGGPSLRPDGYEVSYDDSDTITHYSLFQNASSLALVEAEYERVKSADPATLRRPDKLHGLSPWSDGFEQAQPQRDPASRAAAVVAELNADGTWVSEGSVGKAERLVSVYAARDMVVTIDGKPYPLKEDSRLEVFPGTEPPLGKILISSLFARNIEALSDYIESAK